MWNQNPLDYVMSKITPEVEKKESSIESTTTILITAFPPETSQNHMESLITNDDIPSYFP